MLEMCAGVIIAVAILFIVALRYYGPSFPKGKVQRRIFSGLVIAPLLALLLVLLVGCTRVEVFAGLESSYKISPQCDSVGPSNRMTSNLGVEGCRVISKDGRTELCGVYRHHSCAINPDRETYDSLGFQFRRVLYGHR